MSAPRRGRRALAALTLAATLAVVTAGCGGPGGGAALTEDVACAPALPLARSIVDNQGVPILIRRIDRPDADRLSHELHVPPPPPPPPGAPKPPPDPDGNQEPKTCLFVYDGHYPPGAIAGATPPATSGNYALMVLTIRRPGVERILVTPTLPPDTQPRPWWQRLL